MPGVKTIKVAIIFQGSVLMSTAPANRVISYAEGLLQNNCRVTTFNMHPVPKDGTGDFSSKFIDNHDFNIVDQEPSVIKRKYYYLKYLIKKSSDISKYSHVFFYGDSSFFMIYLFAFCRLFNKKLIFEGSEYPLKIIRNKKIKKIFSLLLANILYKLFDAGIVVSDNLYNYYKRKGRKNIKLIKIPIMVDAERFENIKDLKIPLPKDYIAYCGTMYGDKDGIPVLLKAMKIIKKRFPKIKLLLIGENKNINLINPIMKLIKEYDLNDNVIFTGIIEKKNIPYYLSNARVLVLSRLNNLQAQGGFPTKLGEYLLSGRPAVVTKVGEIQEYLTDGVTALLADAGSAENFAQKVIEALENPEHSESVARRGKELAKEKFDFIIHGKRLSEFIYSDFLINR